MKIFQAFEATVRAHADRPFLCESNSAPARSELTYRAGLDLVRKLSTNLSLSGVKPGHRVAVALDNEPQFFLLFLALNSIGACVVPLNMSLTQRELVFVITHSDSSLIVTLAKHKEQLAQILSSIDSSVQLAIYDGDRIEVGKLSKPRILSDDAAIVYTSGTTGTPKGCLLSDEYFLFAGDWYRNLGGLCTLRHGVERLLTPLPVFHINALVFSFMAMLMTGGCLIQLDRFHPSSWWRTVRATSATAVHYLGVMPALLLSQNVSEDEKYARNLKFGFGAGVEPDHHAEFENRFKFPLVEGWAMTETGAAACLMVVDEPRHVGKRCIGKMPDTVEYRIVDDEENDVDPGTPGELLVRRSGGEPRRGFFSGYYKDPEATSKLWKGGWLHSGDIIVEDYEQSLFFVDRKKNIIRRSGENIAASEVERIMHEHPIVESCVVAAVPDPIRGEEVFASVVSRNGYANDSKTAKKLFEHCYARLAYYKVPGYLAFLETLPTTATQKVKRGKLRDQCLELIADNGAFDFREQKRRCR